MTIKQMITTKMLCKKLDVTPMTVYNWRRQGLPYEKYGVSVRFDEAEVTEWLKNRNQK